MRSVAGVLNWEVGVAGRERPRVLGEAWACSVEVYPGFETTWLTILDLVSDVVFLASCDDLDSAKGEA